MPDTPDGFYLPDGSFRSRQQIAADSASRSTTVEFITPVHHAPDGFDWWQQRVLEAQRARKEAVGRPEHAEVQIRTNAPIILGLTGDVHGGGEDCDYPMFHDDVVFLRDHPQARSLLFGDLTDSYFFNPAVHEHLINLVEQYGYIRTACDELNGKILAAWAGNHSLWASRMGPTFYEGWTDRYNAHYFEGVAYLTVLINSQVYRIVGSHKHRGFSVYNDSHASRRQVLDDAENADVSITAHNHIKATSRQITKVHGGGARPVHYISLGSYSHSSGYSRVSGWHDKAPEEMGSTFLVLFHDRKKVEVYDTKEDAADRVAPFLR